MKKSVISAFMLTAVSAISASPALAAGKEAPKENYDHYIAYQEREAYIADKEGVASTSSSPRTLSGLPKEEKFYFGPDIFWSGEKLKLKSVHTSDDGVYYGLKVGYDYFKPNTFYRGIDGLYSIGRSSVHAKSHGKKLFRNTVPTSFANLEGRVGYNFYSRYVYCSPFVGIGGYHIRPFQSIDYTQDWLYAAFGVKFLYVAGPIFSVGLDLKGMRAFYIEQHIEKRKVSGSNQNTSDTLGYSAALPCSWNIGRDNQWDIRLEPYYTKLSVRNKSNIFGTRILFAYRF